MLLPFAIGPTKLEFVNILLFIFYIGLLTI